MLTRQQVKQILQEGVTAFEEVVEGKIYYHGQPVNPQLGNWGGAGLTGCTVCIAGARYYKRNKRMIFEAVTEMQQSSNLPRPLVMQRVVGDAEILLDAMRLPYLSDGVSQCLSGGMKVPGLFRELGIEVPPTEIRTYLNERQVIDRVKGILLLMEEEDSRALQLATK